MTAKRRMGPENSATRTVLMDAVEAVMREDGYAALSARTVAERAGLKHQLVFYYFESMDDLLLATYRRRTERMQKRIEQALASERPLHAFWTASCEPFDSALTFEYMAMANHNKAIRAETIAFGERIHRLEAEMLSSQSKRATPNAKVFTPLAITTVIASIAHSLGFESVLGISSGHSETKALVEWCLDQFESDAARPGKKKT